MSRMMNEVRPASFWETSITHLISAYFPPPPDNIHSRWPGKQIMATQKLWMQINLSGIKISFLSFDSSFRHDVSYICATRLEYSVFYFILFILRNSPHRGPGPRHYWRCTITHNDAPQSVGLLWTSDQPEAETTTLQHTTLATDRHPCPPVGFEPTISAGERPQTYALDRTATETDNY